MDLPQYTFGFLLHFVRQQWVKFLIFILTSIIWAVNDSIFPYFLKRLINILQSQSGDFSHIFSATKGTLILLGVFWVGMEVLQRIQGVMQIFTFPHFRANIRESVFNYVKHHSQEYFSTHLTGNISKKLSDLPTSCQIIMEIICFQFIIAAAGSVVVLITLWIIQPLFTYIMLIWLFFHLGITFLFLRYGNREWKIHSDSASTLHGKIVDIFTNILNVRLFSRSRYESEYIKKYQKEEIEKSKQAMWVMEITRMALGLNGVFLVFGMIFTLLYGWAHHWVTAGDFTQVGMQTFWVLGWIWFISYQLTLFSRELGTINNALTLIRKGHDLVDAPDAHPIHITKGEIRCEKISFSYHKKSAVFKELDIFIPAGQKVGLVGFSGSGKSTLVNLILRFYDLSSGHIYIDGEDIAKVTQDSLRSEIAVIPQDPVLFHRSLIENIRYGRLEATDEEVITASKLAHCHEFVETMKQGYNTLVGERGNKLSGGQRQRIAIARAILKNAPILILDEATSSLDSATEKLIQESLSYLMQNRTTLVIAHRLSTLADMDKILVFHKGKIIEEGTKETLLEANGHFAMLWSKQTAGFLFQAKKSNPAL